MHHFGCNIQYFTWYEPMQTIKDFILIYFSYMEDSILDVSCYQTAYSTLQGLYVKPKFHPQAIDSNYL